MRGMGRGARIRLALKHCVRADLSVLGQRRCAPLRQPMLQAQIIRCNRSGTFQADRAALSGTQIEEGIFHNDWHAIGAAFIDPFKMHATGELLSLDRAQWIRFIWGFY